MIQFDTPITIEKLTVTSDGMGSTVEAWATAAGAPLWAKVEPLRGQERLLAGQLSEVAQVKFTIRRWPGLTSSHRIIQGGQTWLITSVEDHGRHGYMVVWAKT